MPRFGPHPKQFSQANANEGEAIIVSPSGSDSNRSSPAYAVTPDVVGPVANVIDFGAVGDGVTDDSAAFQAAQAALVAGGTVWVPYTSAGYKIGTGTNATSGDPDTGIVLLSNISWIGESHVELICGARTSNGNFLFDAADVSNSSIVGFKMTGQATSSTDQPYVGVSMSGVVQDFKVENCIFMDFANFSIQYADADTNPTTAYFERVEIRNVQIGGVTGLTGAGSGIDIFPRAELAGPRPVSRDLVIENCWIDVSNNTTTEANHGPQCIKINNTERALVADTFCKGGEVGGLVITNAARDVHVNNLTCINNDTGLIISTNNTIAIGATTGVMVDNYVYRTDGVTGGNGYGLRITGDPSHTYIAKMVSHGGDVRIAELTTGDNLEDLRFGYIYLDEASFVVENAASSTNDIENLQVESLRLVGGAGTDAGQLVLNPTNRSVNNSVFKSVVGQSTDGDMILVNGDGNRFDFVQSIDGNPDSDPNNWIVSDVGNGNSYGVISSIGSNNMDHWINKSGGSGLHLERFHGSVIAASGVRFANQETSSVPTGAERVISAELDLSGAATDSVLFLAEENYYILGISILYVEASSADAGVAIRVGNGASPSSYLSTTSVTGQSLGAVDDFINTTGTNSFGTRVLAQDDFLTAGTAGGKVGTGAVQVSIHLVRASNP